MGLSGVMKAAGRRRLKPVEIYSRKYYESKVRPAVKAAIAEQSIGSKQTLAIIKSLTEKAFAEEDDTVKAEIQAECDAQMDTHDAADGDGEEEAAPSPAARQQ